MGSDTGILPPIFPKPTLVCDCCFSSILVNTFASFSINAGVLTLRIRTDVVLLLRDRAENTLCISFCTVFADKAPRGITLVGFETGLIAVVEELSSYG